MGVLLSGGPTAASSTGVVLVISTNSVASLGTQYITVSIDGIGTAKLGSADFMSTAAAGFPDSISGIANGSVNGISFPSAQHAAVLIEFGSALAKDKVLGNVSITSPIDLRVDVFGENGGHALLGNAANSGGEGIHGLPYATLGDLVWEDLNGNAIQDSGEKGLAGATVQLLDASGAPIAGKSVLTGATGAYSFTGLVPGSYAVQVTGPAGYSATAKDAGSNDATDSDISTTTGKSGIYTLTSGQTESSADAGLLQDRHAGRLGLVDADGNGVQNTGEAGVASVAVQLLDSQGNAIAGRSTTTDATGHYSFTGLLPGSYAVKFTAPAGSQFSAALQGSDTTLDSNPNPATGITAAVTLSSGQPTPLSTQAWCRWPAWATRPGSIRTAMAFSR